MTRGFKILSNMNTLGEFWKIKLNEMNNPLSETNYERKRLSLPPLHLVFNSDTWEADLQAMSRTNLPLIEATACRGE